MGEILSQLGQLFVQSTPTVVLVFFLLVVLDRLLFRRLAGVLKAREEATKGALARARERTQGAEAKRQEYEAAFQAARQEVYRLRETDRREALGERESALQEAREETEVWLRESQGTLAAQVEAGKQELHKASQALAREITDVILGEGSAEREVRASH